MDNRNPLLDVDPDTLSRLDGEGLTRVLRELVWLELNQNGIPHSEAQVPLNNPSCDLYQSTDAEGQHEQEDL